MLYQRWLAWQRGETDHHHGHSHGHGHEHDHHHHDHEREPNHPHGHDHGHPHHHHIPTDLTWRSLITLGVSGGLVPCPDAIAILLVAIAIHRILLGLSLIVAFSLGLAGVLIAIGLVMVQSRRLVDQLGSFSRLAPIMPVISAAVVLILGLGLTVNAIWGTGSWPTSPQSPASIEVAEANPLPKRLETPEFHLDQAMILYVDQDQKNHNQLYLISPLGGNPNCWLMSHTALPTIGYLPMAQPWLIPPYAGQAVQICGPWPLTAVSIVNCSSARTPPVVRVFGRRHVIPNPLGEPVVWRPDGSALLIGALQERDGQAATHLMRFDLTDAQLTDLSGEAQFVVDSPVAWSPNGNWLAVVRRELGEDAPTGNQIWLMRSDGSEAHPATKDADVAYGDPIWSPDGRYLLFHRYPLKQTRFEPAIYILDLTLSQLSAVGVSGNRPTWIQLK